MQHVKNVLPYTAYQQRPVVHQTQSNHGTGYQSKKRGITVLEVQSSGDGDDDEWVSSESGAVTPADNDEEDGPPTPTDTTTMTHRPQQFPIQTPTTIPPDSTAILRAANADTDGGPNYASHNKSDHSSNVNDANYNVNLDTTTHSQTIRPALHHLQFQSQAQLHPMTRTQATTAVGAKQRTVMGLSSPALKARKSKDDTSGRMPEELNPIEVPSNDEGTKVATSAIPNMNNDQLSHPQQQLALTELEKSATPRVGIAPLQPLSSEVPRFEAQRRPQVRQRPQSMADIRLIDTNIKAENEEAEDTFIESPATELPPSRTRPPSTRSMRSIYHHPLIRTRSYAPSTPTLTAPPAFSPTTASPTLAPNASSGMIWGSPQSNTDTEHSHNFWLSKLKRKNSQSSVNSIATLPVTSASASAAASAALATTNSSKITATRERQRTLSHTSAALSSLAAAAAHQSSHHYGFGVPGFVQHGVSRPASPPLPAMFPPPPKPVHSMLPPGLLAFHSSATAYQRVMAESLMRIGKARTEKAV